MTKRILWTAVCLLLATSITAQDKDLTKAIKKYDKYSYDTAAEELQDVDRKTTEVRRKLAQSYINTQQYGLAEKELDIIMGSDDKRSSDILQYALILKKNGKYQLAQNSMEAYYELEPSDSRGQASHANPSYYSGLLTDQGQFKVVNLPANSEQEDFGTSYYKDQLVFASSREGIKPVRRRWNWNRLPFLDMYVATQGSGAEIGGLKEFYSKGNKKYHEGPVAFDEMGEFMVYTRNNYSGTDKQGVRKLKLYESTMKEEKWGDPKAFPYNSDEYSVGHATISADGNTMYFASDMPGGLGGVDIYRTERSNDKWSKPVNMGDRINTEGNEMFPYIHQDGVLFFASEGHMGLGGLDVFATPLTDGQAGAVKNLGTPINTNADDFALIVDKGMESGYFSSNRTSGKGDDDIYYFDMLKPLSFGKSIEGIAMDKEGNPLAETEVALRDAQGNVIATAKTGEDGAYTFSADPDMDYTLSGLKQDYFEGDNTANTRGDEDVVKADLVLEKDPGFSLYGLVTDKGTGAPIDGVKVKLMDNLGGGDDEFMTSSAGDFRKPLSGKKLNDRVTYNVRLERDGYLSKTVTYNKSLERPGQYDLHEEMDLSMTKLEVGLDIGAAININPIYFDVNKYDIRPDARIELQKIVDVMNEYPTMVIELGSHTDCRASDEYNRKLSDRRAKASAKWVQNKIKDGSRIYGKGYGESQLVNHCACGRTDPNNTICSEEEHQENRRTEFRIVKM